MTRTLYAALLLALAANAHAQDNDVATWHDANMQNQTLNLRSASNNPTRIAYNAVRDFAVANVDYTLSRGSFHAIDDGHRSYTLGGYIGGLRRVERFDLQGHLAYTNRQDKEQKWGNRLWNDPSNPFSVCDSVPGDASTEAFDMGFTAAYSFDFPLKAGIELGLRTGSRADQNDPRPGTTTSVVPITLGAEYTLADQWTVGLSGGVRLFSSLLDYTNVQPLNNHRYFIMKGMGDYEQRRSVNETSYERHYNGTTWNGQLQLAWTAPNKRWADIVEGGITSGNEDATDGGDDYSFRGGDYKTSSLHISNRLSWRPTNTMLHQLTLAYAEGSGEAKWYDQKRSVDTEHNNLVYYEVLAKSINHKSSWTDMSARYRLDLLDGDGRRDIYADLTLGQRTQKRTQFLGYATPKQKIEQLYADATVGKLFNIKKIRLQAQVTGGIVSPSTEQWANGSKYAPEYGAVTTSSASDVTDIADAYTRRVFEYEAAARAHVGAAIDASMPVSATLAVGLFANFDTSIYTGQGKTSPCYDGTTRTTAQFGTYLRF